MSSKNLGQRAINDRLQISIFDVIGDYDAQQEQIGFSAGQQAKKWYLDAENRSNDELAHAIKEQCALVMRLSEMGKNPGFGRGFLKGWEATR